MTKFLNVSQHDQKRLSEEVTIIKDVETDWPWGREKFISNLNEIGKTRTILAHSEDKNGKVVRVWFLREDDKTCNAYSPTTKGTEAHLYCPTEGAWLASLKPKELSISALSGLGAPWA